MVSATGVVVRGLLSREQTGQMIAASGSRFSDLQKKIEI
jgi:hypothetical protein